jgi:hypothetical protein
VTGSFLKRLQPCFQFGDFNRFHKCADEPTECFHLAGQSSPLASAAIRRLIALCASETVRGVGNLKLIGLSKHNRKA